MKGKKRLLLLTLTFLLAAIIASAPLVKPAPLALQSPLYDTRLHIRECPPPAGNVTGEPTNAYVWFIVDIDIPDAWDNTSQGIAGYEFSVHFDPDVLTPINAYAAAFDYYLFDWTELNDASAHNPKLLVEEINATTGDIKGIGELIFGFETLGRGAGGSSYSGSQYGSMYGLTRLRFRSKSQTAYTRVDIYDAVWVDLNETKHAFDVVEDGHYNQAPFKWQHSNATLIDPTNPVGTSWHELYPNYCTSTTINDWVDNTDGVLSPCDFIKLDSTWWHVEEVTITIETKTAYGVPANSTNDPSSDSGVDWVNPAYAYSSDDTYAEAPKNTLHQYGTYGFSIPSDALITGVEVGFEAYTAGGELMGITCSWDGGTSWATEYLSAALPATDPGVPTWANFTDATSWTVDMLNNTNFIVEARTETVGGYRTVYVDWIPARVSYDEPLPMYIEYLAGFDFMDEAMANANGTYWHEVYPEFSTIYNLTGWEDSDASGNITYCDYIDLTDFNATSTTNTYHVEDVHTDIIISGPVPSPPEFPLGAALEVSLIVAVAYVWWRSRRKTKIKNHAKLAY